MRAILFGKRLFLTPYDILTCVLLFVLTVTVALTYHMYGFTTDEPADHH